MIHSMTGFAVADASFDGMAIRLEIRGVNSRFFDLNLRLSDELRSCEPLLREAISARVKRGKVDVRLGSRGGIQDSASMQRLELNTALIGQLAQAQEQVRSQMQTANHLTVAEVLSWPGVLIEPQLDENGLHAFIERMLVTALDDFIASRAREGEKLAAILRLNLTQMHQAVVQLKPCIGQIVAQYRDRLEARLRDAVATLDDERISQEVVYFAQRIDVAEELDRLQVHLEEVERVIGSNGLAGKRLDFLMQELQREANTLAAKAAGHDVSQAAIQMKVVIEQMREQVQNIE